MAVELTDIKLYRTALTGGMSLGGAVGAAVACGDLHNLFDPVTGPESAAGRVEYRCLIVANEAAGGGDATAYGLTVYLDAQDGNGATISGTAIDPAAAAPVGSAVTARTVANETTAPSPALTFGAATARLNLGDIPAGSCRAIWLRRTATNGPPQAADLAAVRWDFDSEE